MEVLKKSTIDLIRVRIKLKYQQKENDKYKFTFDNKVKLIDNQLVEFTALSLKDINNFNLDEVEHFEVTYNTPSSIFI